MTKLDTGQALVEDFADGISLEWEAFSDRVMGGESVVRELDLVEEAKLRFLRLEGSVSTANGGGFIQARARFPGGVLDGSGFRGLDLMLRGTTGGYAVHLRTTSCPYPWSFYGALLPVRNGWSELRVPFDALRGVAVPMGPFESGRILSIGLLAEGRDFEARLDIARVSLYR